MKKINFDYSGALEAGYNDEEIMSHLSSQVPDFDVQEAISSGYTPQEINQYLSNYKQERPVSHQIGRGALQFGISALQTSLPGMVYEASVAPLVSKEAQTAAYGETLSEDINRLMEQKETGVWDEQDQALLDSLIGQHLDKEKAQEFVKTIPDITIKGLAEKATGLDLTPEGTIEHTLSWLGYLKDPKKFIPNLKSVGMSPKLLKEVIPGTKSLRAISAATGFEMAQDNYFGPAGQIGAAIVGDILGGGPAAIKYAVTHPKELIAETVNLFTRGNSKGAWTKQIIEDAKAAGIQLDAGTITNSNIIRMAQARASQSALSGQALDNFRKDLSSQIIKAYEELANQVGGLTFENSYQASEAIKEALKVNQTELSAFKDFEKPARSLQGRVSIEERPPYQQEFLQRISPAEFRNDYVAGETLKIAAQDIRQPIKDEFTRRWSEFNTMIAGIEGPQAELAGQLRRFVNDNRGSLLLGESTAEYRVLSAAENLLNRLEVEGSLVNVSLQDLIKTKRTLADVANWEIGTTDFATRYKDLVGEIDAAVIRTLEGANPQMREAYQELNAEYSNYKDIFENDNVKQLFEPKNENYNAIYNSYINNPDRLRSLEDMFYMTPRGEEVINQIKRDYAQRITSDRNLTERDLRNLAQVLGPQFDADLANYSRLRADDLARPLPMPARRERLGLEVPAPATKSSTKLEGRKYKESDISKRKKFYESLKDKKPEQIMKQMDTVKGIKDLKKVLELTPEGKELFKQLARYKLEEMIGSKMKHDIKQHVQLGTFSGLLKTSKNKAIVKELVGDEAFNQLRLLQKNSAVLEESISKFYNASKSGSTLADVGIISTGVVGILTGNPFAIAASIGTSVGMRTSAYLLSDPKFLKLLENAVITNKNEAFKSLLKKMQPRVDAATLEAYKSLEIGEESEIK